MIKCITPGEINRKCTLIETAYFRAVGAFRIDPILLVYIWEQVSKKRAKSHVVTVYFRL